MGWISRIRAKNLQEWLREHRLQEASAEAKDKKLMSEVGGRERGTEARREVGEEGRTQMKW